MARVFRFLKCNVSGFFIFAKQGALFHDKIAFPSGVVSLRTGHLAFFFSLIFLLLRAVYAFHPPFHCHLFSPAALSLLVNPISCFLFPLPKSAILVLPDPNRLSSFAVCPASALFYPATIRLTFSIFSPQVFSPFGKSNALILLARPVLFRATPGRCPRFLLLRCLF